MDFSMEEMLELPMKWLEIAVDCIPEWPPSWLPDFPPEWLIDLVEKYAPYLPSLPSSYFQELFQLGLPHFYVQQNVCEKAFDVGVLSLTLGSLLLSIYLLRRCLDPHRHREQYVCEQCRAEKSEVLSEDLIIVEKRVDSLKTSCQNVNKKLQGCLQGQGIDGPALEKRLRKLPQIQLSGCMAESSVTLGEDSIFGIILGICGNVQKLLGNELLEYESDLEKGVINKQVEVLEIDIPNIVKQRKHLAKLILDMDSAKTRYQTAARHSVQASGTNAAKVDVIKEEFEDASLRVEQCRDTLIGDMFNLISKESEFAHHLVNLVKIQAQYHKKALNILENYTSCMEEEINKSQWRPVYGCPLEDHLKVTERQIAWPIEFCICHLIEYGFSEEGLFRVAGSASEVKKLKSAFDANVTHFLNLNDYVKDPNAVAGALKSYLRELPNPLMTHKLYSDWMEAARITDIERRVQELSEIVQMMPVPYLNNLRYLMKFLNKMTDVQDITKMTAQNLAIVLAPNLIWDPQEGATLGMNMSLANTYSSIVDTLISYADTIFPGDVEFELSSPMIKSARDIYGPSSGHLHYSDNEYHPPNGDLDFHSSLHVPEGSSLSTQASPQMGGSPKSLRRNKKPAPPAPAGSREKPFLTPEKPVFERTLSGERFYEKPQQQPPLPEKLSVERKLSSSSDREKPSLAFASARTNHVDRAHSNSVEKVQMTPVVIAAEKLQVSAAVAEKPQIPEKPTFEKRTSILNDVGKVNAAAAPPAAPVPAERHHLEKRQVQMLSIEKSQPTVVHLTEDGPIPVHEESKHGPPEIITPAVESESESESEEEVAPRANIRPYSPATVDMCDYYRPYWYGTQQEEIEETNETDKHHPATEEIKPAKKPSFAHSEGFKPEQMRRISVEVLPLMALSEAEAIPDTEAFEVESFAEFAVHGEESLSSIEKPELEAPVRATDQKAELPRSFAQKTDVPSSTLQKIEEMLHETSPQPEVVTRVKHSPQPEVVTHVDEEYHPVVLQKQPEPERPSSSEELIVIGCPPHSISFVTPSGTSSLQKPVQTPRPEEPKPVQKTLAFDLLGNLSFLSTKSQSSLDKPDAKSDLASASPEKEAVDAHETSVPKKIFEPPLKKYDFDVQRRIPLLSQKSEEKPRETTLLASNIRYASLDSAVGRKLSPSVSFDKAAKQESVDAIDESGRKESAEEPPTFYPLTKIPSYPKAFDYERAFGSESRSESITDSDRWSQSEESASPERPGKLSQEGRQISLESKSSYSSYAECERPDSPFHFRSLESKSPFAVLAERPLSPSRFRAERPYSPPSKSKSVPCTPPTKPAGRRHDEYHDSQESLQSTARSVDARFAGNDDDPVAKPRRPRRLSSQAKRPKRPQLPPQLDAPDKPKRPPKPPLPRVAQPEQSVQYENVSAMGRSSPEERLPSDADMDADMDVELEPIISRGITNMRGLCEMPRSENLSDMRRTDYSGNVAIPTRMRTHGILPGSPAAPKRPPRPQPPPPPPPFKPRGPSASEDTHL